ncbi:hypothetical protein ACF8C6_09035 [Pseudomonas sp. zbq_18]|uniref:hypothetical protein n=1 Tax=Pseudomonas sp. zbq_18 TaxID=3367251 RepID=UPI00370C6390
MSTAKIQPRGGQFGGAARYGNLTTLRYTLETNASGVPANSQQATALQINDVVQFEYPLPAGFLIEDVQVIVSDHFGASVTGDLGFAYADGVDDASLPQSATAFGSALALSAAARLRTTAASKLKALPKDAYLILTIKGAAVAQVGVAQVVVHGERQGK